MKNIDDEVRRIAAEKLKLGAKGTGKKSKGDAEAMQRAAALIAKRKGKSVGNTKQVTSQPTILNGPDQPLKPEKPVKAGKDSEARRHAAARIAAGKKKKTKRGIDHKGEPNADAVLQRSVTIVEGTATTVAQLQVHPHPTPTCPWHALLH